MDQTAACRTEKVTHPKKDVSINVPLASELRILRLYPPAEKSSVDLASLKASNANGPIKTGNFTAR